MGRCGFIGRGNVGGRLLDNANRRVSGCGLYLGRLESKRGGAQIYFDLRMRFRYARFYIL